VSDFPANRLAAEASPYLRQHAHNPVDWFPWGDEAFAEARRRDVPVFLSVGYAACHWCHVMERESFADPAIARLLNQTFVCVKVDREERPDLDHLYMGVCQALTGSGGWPLTVLLTPGRLPFHAGTYFPPRSRGGRPGVDRLCAELSRLWAEERGRLETLAGELGESLAAWHGPTRRGRGDDGAVELRSLAEAAATEACRHLAARYDARHGGFGGAPKFPSPHTLLLLLRAGWDEERQAPRPDEGGRWLAMALHTLLAMSRGALRDQLAGGFHRYSTDAAWRIPHFEKMLYDQAMLALALADGAAAASALAGLDGAEAARLAAEADELEEALGETLDYVVRDLVDEGGGFHSAEDADSEGEEGRYYVWDWQDLRDRLSPEDLALAAAAWSLGEEGNWPPEGGAGFRGRNVLHPGRAPALAAHSLGLAPEDFLRRRDGLRRLLLELRSGRARPARDHKVLTDWNGLMIAALARGGRQLARPDWLAAARRAAQFLLDGWRGGEGLLHCRRPGQAGIPALLDDHAFLVRGLLGLAEAETGGRDWLGEAAALQEEQDRLFWDPGLELYRMCRAPSDLPQRPVEEHDGALPCGNSMAAGNLLRLGRLLDRPDFQERAARLVAGLAARGSLGGGQAMLLADLLDGGRARLLEVEGPDEAARQELLRGLEGCFLPGLLLAPRQGARSRARLCGPSHCLAEVESAAALARQLAGGREGGQPVP
jgi:hypothetical protein